MIARLNTSEEINAMLTAIAAAGVFTIDRTPETVEVKHTKSGKLVLAALKKSARGGWITRTDENLFS